MAARDQVRCPQCGVPNDPGALFCSRCGASQVRPGHTPVRRRRTSLAGATMALACLMALGITVFVLYTIISGTVAPEAEADTTTSVYTGAPGTTATLNTPTTVPATSTTAGRERGSILVRPSAATSSSNLKATNIADFRPTNVLDGDTATAWIEGAKGSGVGQWIQLDFDEAVPLARIEITNGYQKDDDLFAGYVRIKSLEIGYSDGSRQVVELLDEQGIQVIEPSVDETEWIKFTILSVHPSYELPNAAISDVRIYEALQ